MRGYINLTLLHHLGLHLDFSLSYEFCPTKGVKMGYWLPGKEYRAPPDICSGDYKQRSDADVLATLGRAQPGDLILAKTRGAGFALGRVLTRNRYDHIAVVLHDSETLNIVMPKTIKLPLSTFGKPGNAPLIMRPNWKAQEQRDSFIAEMEGFVGGHYNLKRTLLGILVIVLSTWLGIRIRIKKLKPQTAKWICTEAIIVSLLKTFPVFKAIEGIKLDYNTLGFGTTNDFLRISCSLPHLMKIEKREA